MPASSFALGGRRRPDAASTNVAWRHPAFRAYADHLATEEYAAAGADALCHLGVLLLPYALYRWASGREALIGTAIVAVPVSDTVRHQAISRLAFWM